MLAQFLGNSRELASIPLPKGWRKANHSSAGQEVVVLQAEPDADVLVVPLNAAGRREIHLGLVARPKFRNAAMQVKVSTDPFWRRVRPMRFIDDSALAIQDGCLGVFDLRSDSQLLVRAEPVDVAALAYVATVEPDCAAPQRHKRNVGAVFDTNMSISRYRIGKPEDLRAVLAPYIDSDFSHIFWGTGVGSYSPLYFSEALGWHGQEQKEFMADHRERTAGVMRMLAERGVDPLRFAIEFCHAHGLQLWANDRVSKNHEHDFRDDFPGGRFLLQHQEKRVQDIDGSLHDQVTMSFAYPEIREMKVRTLVEQARYDVDGLYIDFCRKAPLVGWEPVVLDSFRRKHGLDPRQKPRGEWFIHWIEHQCGFITQFMRDLRKALGQVEKERGRQIPVAAQVNGGWRFTDGIPSCKTEGLDVETWAREGLVDILAPAEWTALMHAHQSLDRFGPLVEGTACKLWGALGPQFREGHRSKEERTQYGPECADLDPWRLMRHAADMYNQGADGVYIWEAQDMPSVPQRWEVLKNIGDRQELNRIFSPLIGPFDGRRSFPQVPLGKA